MGAWGRQPRFEHWDHLRLGSRRFYLLSKCPEGQGRLAETAGTFKKFRVLIVAFRLSELHLPPLPSPSALVPVGSIQSVLL